MLRGAVLFQHSQLALPPLAERAPDCPPGLAAIVERMLAKRPEERFPDFELFPGSEAFLLDGLRGGAVGTISASANVNGAMMRKLFDDWQGANADELQAQISAIRTTLQGYPLIPVMKALLASSTISACQRA